MNDLDHFFGNDISQTKTGDLSPVSGVEKTKQRILRRLLTNPADDTTSGDYIWHPEYGAGLPRRVGDVIDVRKMKALIRGQVLMEAAVAKVPEPAVEVQAIPGGMTVSITYADAQSKSLQFLSFNVTR